MNIHWQLHEIFMSYYLQVYFIKTNTENDSYVLQLKPVIPIHYSYFFTRGSSFIQNYKKATVRMPSAIAISII